MHAAMLAALALCAPPGDAVLVQFLSPTCPHCKAMEPIVARLAGGGCPVQVIDVEQQPDVARQFKVTGVPTFIALSKGRETGRIVGATSYDKLLQLYQGAGGKLQNGPMADDSAYAGSPAATATNGVPPEQAALATSVRLKVEDGRGFGFGTGTIIDTHENEALVVTCGHLFRESQGRGSITADLFVRGAPQSVEGELIAYDLDRDIALVSLRVPFAVQAAVVAPPGCTVRPGDQVFSVGCDRGQDPTVRRSRITAVNKYMGRPNYTAAGQPVDGRSGGGLFTADGQLIGICNAADPADDEGLYAALASIHWQLDQIGQSEIYQRGARRDVAQSQPGAADVAATMPRGPAEVPAQPLPTQPLPTQPLPVLPASFQQPYAAADPSPPLDLAPVAAAGDDTEIVVIFRSKSDPSQRSEVYVVDHAPPDLIARITQAARASGQQRAEMAQARSASLPPSRGQPSIVRGQSEP